MTTATDLTALLSSPPLDGLKAIADFVEQASQARGVRLQVNTVTIWRWKGRRGDPLPVYRRRNGKGGVLADPAAVLSWLWRQRFSLFLDGESHG